MQGNKEERINIEIKSDDEKNPLEIFRDRRLGNKSLSTQFQGEENEGERWKVNLTPTK
jgi:hypothetical protein